MSVAAPLRRGWAAPRPGLARWFFHNEQVVLTFALLAAIVLANYLKNPRTLAPFGIQTTVNVATPFAFAALAQMCAVLVRGVDLSVGSQIALVNVVAATTLQRDPSGGFVFAVLILMMATLVGLATGLVISVTRMPDIIATLATSAIVYGAALVVLPSPGGAVPRTFARTFSGATGGVPYALILLVAALVLVWLPLRRSRLGLAMYALGSDPQSARLAGVDERRARMTAYAFDGLFCGLAGIALSSLTASGDPNIGVPYTLNSIAAIMIGGVALAGGRGSALGAVGAAFFLSGLISFLFFFGVDPNFQIVLQGLILIVVTGAAAVFRRVRA